MNRLAIIILISATLFLGIIGAQVIAKAKVDAAKCIGCRQCEPICPNKAISIVNGKSVVDTAKCIGCGKCVAACPITSISLDSLLFQKGQTNNPVIPKVDNEIIKRGSENKPNSNTKTGTLSTTKTSADANSDAQSLKPDTAIKSISLPDTSQTQQAISSPQPQNIAYVDVSKCIGCGLCAMACPNKAIKMEKGKAVIDPQKCTAHGICANACPLNLIKLKGKTN